MIDNPTPMVPGAELVRQRWHELMKDLTELRKTGKNTHQGYKFRGIDAVLDHLGPMVRRHQLITEPHYTYLGMQEIPALVETKKSTLLVTLQLDLRIVSIEDGSSFTITTIGQAGDTQDKAANKAMSLAYKYAIFQGATLPNDDMEDGDTDAPRGVDTPANQEAPAKKATTKTTASADLDKARKRAFVQLKELDVPDDRDTRLSYCIAIVEREVDSSLKFTLPELQDLNKELAKRIKAAKTKGTK